MTTERDAHRSREQTRLAALLALHRDRPPPPDPPGEPDNAALAALLDGRLSGSERERVLAQLDADPAAYRAWLAAAAELRPAVNVARQPTRTPVRRWTIAAAAAVLAVVVGLWTLAPVPLERRINADLAALAERTLAPPEPLANRGLVTRGGPDPATLAAQVGYRAGRAALSPGTTGPAEEPEEARATPVGYQIGRWIALLEAAAAAEPPPGARFWAAQMAVGGRLEAAGASLPARPESQRLIHEVRGLNDLLRRTPTTEETAWPLRLTAQVRTARLRLGLDETAEH